VALIADCHPDFSIQQQSEQKPGKIISQITLGVPVLPGRGSYVPSAEKTGSASSKRRALRESAKGPSSKKKKLYNSFVPPSESGSKNSPFTSGGFYKQKFEKLLSEKEKFNIDLRKEKIKNKLLQQQVNTMEKQLAESPKHKLLCRKSTTAKKRK